jgi:hypothetical protein
MAAVFINTFDAFFLAFTLSTIFINRVRAGAGSGDALQLFLGSPAWEWPAECTQESMPHYSQVHRPGPQKFTRH